MRNLLLFIWKNQFTFLFLSLEVVAFAMLSSGNNYQSSKMHEAGVAMSGTLYNAQESYRQYLGLRDENDKLREENARLREQLSNENRTGHFLSYAGLRCLSAKAINSTYHLSNNFVIIDRGSSSGVLRESGVIGPNGIVGFVHSVSENYASVMPLLNSHAQVNARLKHTSYFGICKWDGLDERHITLENIPNHVQINAGDTVVTRGSGGLFPSGLLIGYAVSSMRDESSGFQQIKLELATDFRKLNSLYVILNEAKPELDSLHQTMEVWTEK